MQNDLRNMDLNLLVALEALLREESVTRAARELGRSQSAVSHALNRLRKEFDDELLVRSGRSMVRTGRGDELLEPLREALDRLGQVVASGGLFDPRESEAAFEIATNDYAQFVLLPPLIEKLQRRAPNIDLRVRELGSEPPTKRLATGAVDMALTLGLPEQVPETLYRRDLFQLDLVSLVRRDHPVVGDELDLEVFCELPHILISPMGDDEGVVDSTLRDRGRSRRVALVVPHFMVAPHLVAATDMVLTTARSVAESFAEFLPIRLLEPPLELKRGTVSMVWHPRSHGEECHRWLRHCIRDVVAEKCFDARRGGVEELTDKAQLDEA